MAGRAWGSGRLRAGITASAARTSARVAAVPSDHRGTAEGGGSTPSTTQATRFISAAR